MDINLKKVIIKNDDISISFEIFTNKKFDLINNIYIESDNIIEYYQINDVYESNITLNKYIDSPICLYENSEYYIEIESNNNIDEIYNILYNSVNFKGLRLIGNKIEGYFNSNNYIGKLNLSFLGIDSKLVNVVSRKTDYEKEYSVMIADINDFFIELLSKSNSIFDEMRSFSSKLNYSNKMYYSKFVYIQNILTDLINWIRYLENNYYSKLIEVKEEKNIWEISDLDIDGIIDSLNDDNIIHSKNRILPLKIKSTEYEETKNTNENKFIKFFLEYLKNEILEIKKVVINSLKKDCDIILEKIDLLLISSFFRGIDTLNEIPYNSQVLQKRYPYNQIFKTFNNLQLITLIDNNITQDSFYVGQKDVPTLYEYWCFLKIHKILSSRYINDNTENDWISFEENKMNVNIIHGSSSKFTISNSIELVLYYNKEYINNQKENIGYSYSQTFRPDISLELYDNSNLISIIHFDAKYKLPEKGSYVPEDLNKMHAYKDGIVGTIGSFILTLGKKNEVYYKDNLDYPSVGAFSLIPGNIENTYLKEIIENFIDIYKN